MLSAEALNVFAVSGLAILAGVFGFVTGGVIEMRKFRQESEARRSEAVKIPS